MSKSVLTRLSELEEIAKKAKSAHSRLRIDLDDTNITIQSVNAKLNVQMEAPTPLEAVEALEKYVIKKMPEHVIFSCHFSDLFDLFPDMREAFAEYTPVVCNNISVGDLHKGMEGLSLKQIILYHHVHTWGRDCLSNREKGIIYSDEDFMRMLPHEGILFAVLRDILEKEQHWRETSGKYKPDTPNRCYGNMRYGRQGGGETPHPG